MRSWRQTHQLNAEQRRRANARSYANVYLNRGLLERGPCEDCGIEHDAELHPVEMHHEDYDKPLEVTWLCRECHLGRHDDLNDG